MQSDYGSEVWMTCDLWLYATVQHAVPAERLQIPIYGVPVNRRYSQIAKMPGILPATASHPPQIPRSPDRTLVTSRHQGLTVTASPYMGKANWGSHPI
jgi:hypothetical protein